MLKLGVLVALIVGACWLFGALVGGLFKLTFGLFGVLLGGLFSVFALVLAALLVVPIVLFALLPLLLPVLGIAALVWLVVHASRTQHEPSQTTHG